MGITTSQLLADILDNSRDYGSAFDVILRLNSFTFTRHRFGAEDTNSLWHLSYCDDAEEIITNEEFLKLYPDELGEIWETEY